jgi:hypothetical protein
MKKYLALGILVLLLFQCKVKQPYLEETIEKEFIFPLDWVGHYKGTLKIYKENKESTTINMELIIGNPNGAGYYPWTLIYNDEDIREYGLEAINSSLGHYRIDEFNSIQIEGYLNNGHFVSRFDVMGSDLLVDYHRTNEGINVSFYITKTEAETKTGGEIIALDTVPSVKSYPILVFQKAELLRIPD